MIKRKSTEIVLVVLTLFIIEGLFQTSIGDYYTGWQFYVGVGLVGLFWLLYFIKTKKLKTIVTISLILGSLNLIQFTYYTINFAFSWTPPGHVFTSIGFQPIILLILLFYIITNFSRALTSIQSITSSSPEEKQESKNQLVEKFKSKLQNEKKTKLENIVLNPKDYQKEYVVAAKEVLESKYVM